MTTKPFDAGRYLTKLRGKDYLEVKWRLLWLRTEHPDARIDTQMVDLQSDRVIFKATVSIPEGGSATGWAEQGPKDFAEWFEKCETKAIGRALGALGYGTQFTDEFEYDDGDDAVTYRVVDSPVQSVASADSNSERHDTLGVPKPITSKQVAEIQQLEKALGQHPGVLNAWAIEHYSRPIEELHESEARALIAGLKLKVQRIVEAGVEPTPA